MIKKVKHTVRWTCFINDLNVEEMFVWNVLQKIIAKNKSKRV